MTSSLAPTFRIGTLSGDHIDLALVEVIPADSPCAGDFRLSARVWCGGFMSPECIFWIARPALDEFLDALRVFDEKRVGRVLLEGMSPDDFMLGFSSDSAAKSPVVFGTVTGVTLFRFDNSPSSRLDFAFELDSGVVTQVVAQFAHFVPASRDA